MSILTPSNDPDELLAENIAFAVAALLQLIFIAYLLYKIITI